MCFLHKIVDQIDHLARYRWQFCYLHTLSDTINMSLPQFSRALVLRPSPAQVANKDSPVYHDVILERRSVDQTLLPDEVLVKVQAVAFNHRDVSLTPTYVFQTIITSVIEFKQW